MRDKLRINNYTYIALTIAFIIYIITVLLTPIAVIGKYSFILVLVLIFMSFLTRKHITRRELFFFLPVVLFNILYLIKMDNWSDIRSFTVVTNLTIFILQILLISSISLRRSQVRLLSYVYMITIPILAVLSFVTDHINTNTIAALALFLSYFPILYLTGYRQNIKKTTLILVFVLTLFLMFFNASRAVILSLGFVVMTYLLWKLIASSRILYNLYFLMITIFGYFVIVIYPKIYLWSGYEKLNELSMAVFNKQLLTGRDKLWENIVNVIKDNPFLGYGSTAAPQDFFPTTLSSHNLYLQTCLQIGILGLFLLLLFLFFVWRSLWKNRHDLRVRLTACYFIGILVHQLFEVTLTQRHFVLGLVQWLIIGFGINFSFSRHMEQKRQQ